MAKPIRKITTLLGESLLIGVGFGTHLIYLFRTVFVDWPEMLVYPWFLTKGMVYYRDVVLAYVPGAYYLMYALYSWLGFTPESERLIAYGVILLTDLLVYVVIRTMTGSISASALAMMYFVWWNPILSGNTIWYETLLAPLYLTLIYAVYAYVGKPSWHRASGIGLVLALASLIKQTAVWPVALTLAFVWLTADKRWKGFVYAVIAGGMVLIVQIASWAYFAARGAGSEYLFWVFEFLGELLKKQSHYALLPAWQEIGLLLPALTPLVFLLVYKRDRRVTYLVLLAVVLFLAGLPRWGLHRLQPLLAVASVGFGFLIHELAATKKIALAALGCVLLVAVAFGSWRSYRVFITLRDPMQPQFFGAAYQQILTFVRANVDQPYYVLGNYDYLYYGMDDKPAVLPWVPLFPWNAEVHGMQARLVSELETQRVPYIVYIPFHPTGYYEDYQPGLLNLYIGEKYEKILPLPVEGGVLYRRK